MSKQTRSNSANCVSNDDLAKLIHELSAKMESSSSEINSKIDLINDKLSKDMMKVKNAINIHEAKINDIERKLLENDIIITGIPFVQNENVVNIFEALSKSIGFMNATSCLNTIFRLPGERLTRPIVAKFSSGLFKHEFFNLYIKYQQLSLMNIGLKSNDRIYINDSLTKKNSAIKKQALILLKNKVIHKVGVKFGLVYIKTKPTAAYMKIYNLDDLPT